MTKNRNQTKTTRSTNPTGTDTNLSSTSSSSTTTATSILLLETNYEALTRLAGMLTHLEQQQYPTEKQKQFEGDMSSSHAHNLNDSWGHWRILPPELQQAYEMLFQSAEFIKATSTKFTLLSKIDLSQGSALSTELRQACEWIGTATLTLYPISMYDHDSSFLSSSSLSHSEQHWLGCSQPTRMYFRQAARAILATVLSLLEIFRSSSSSSFSSPSSSLSFSSSFSHMSLQENQHMAAQKTGAIWNACDTVLDKKVPKGNRASIRRSLFTWIRECNDTLQEFEQLLFLSDRITATKKSPMTITSTGTEDLTVIASQTTHGEEEDHDLFYTHAKEIHMVEATLAILKCSRGILQLTLSTLEYVGDGGNTSSWEEIDLSFITTKEHREDKIQRKQLILQWMKELYEWCQSVGQGITEIGVLLYPPLDLNTISSELNSETTHSRQSLPDSMEGFPLGQQLVQQKNAIQSLLHHILSLSSQDNQSKDDSSPMILLSTDIVEKNNRFQQLIQERMDNFMVAWKEETFHE